jgi:hypothetical protein
LSAALARLCIEADGAFAKYGLIQSGKHNKVMQRLLQPDLLALNNLFLAQRIAEDSSALLQALAHKRCKLRRSLVVTLNRVVQD